MTEYGLTLMSEKCQTGGWGICHRNVFPSCILYAESLMLVWTKYEGYMLHTSTVIYTFQNLNTPVNNTV